VGRAAPPGAAPSAPPYNECPPVGADASCGILIQVTDSNNVVLGDPSQGPFDGADDTLIGVLNSSGSTVTDIAIASDSSVFGFDGDGLCTFSPGPAGCPFGPTGYEGLSPNSVVVGGPSAAEQGGASNPSENSTTCSTPRPVNCATVFSGIRSPTSASTAAASRWPSPGPTVQARPRTVGRGHPLVCGFLDAHWIPFRAYSL
jgi:hypothetical protein